jgi:DNA-directed RNA polymerase specialized sigma24 family protein
MTDEERIVKYHLESYLDAMRKLTRAKELYERIYTSATGAKIQYMGTGSGTPHDTIGNAVVMLDEAKEKIIEKQMDADAIRQEIELLCSFIKSDNARFVIEQTYLEDKTRGEIADALGCSLQSVTNYKVNGIREIAKSL